MAKKTIKEEIPIIPTEPIKISIEEFLHENGLSYAHYVLTQRALLGSAGLKPVDSRILYGMKEMNLKPGSTKAKAARISGEVMGKYHPHAASSIEGALARMGQSFNTRVPLIEYQGELGTVPGDSAAAPRYWEATLNSAGYELVRDVDNHACDMIYTETGEYMEPAELPVRWPVGIINGSNGIAVGYACSLPPHNPDEVIDACIAFLENKIKEPEDVLNYIKGPDFPTGGQLMGLDGVKEYMTTGKGTYIVRGKYKIDQLPRGRTQITFYELPYQVSPESVKEAIAKAQSKNGSFKEISEVKELSSGEEGTKLAIYIKSGSNIENVLNELWKKTPCESKQSANITVLLDGVPAPNTTMIELINQFINQKIGSFVKGNSYKAEQLSKQLHKLNGLIAIQVDIDKAINIIRNSKTDTIAKKELEKEFNIDDIQADAILEMKLRQLTQSDKLELMKKAKSIEDELNYIRKCLEDPKTQKKVIIQELQAVKKIISDERRTEILGITNEELANNAKEQAKQERTLQKDIECYINFKDNQVWKTTAETKDSYLKTTSLGQIYSVLSDGNLIPVSVESIPVSSKASVESLVKGAKNSVALISAINPVFIATKEGNGNIIKPPFKEGPFASLLPEDEIISAYELVNVDDFDVAIVSEEAKLLRFPLKSVRQTKQGAGLVKISGLETPIVDVCLIKEFDILVTETPNEIKYTDEEDCPSKSRGGKGYLIHKSKEKINSFYILNDVPKEYITPRSGKGQKK